MSVARVRDTAWHRCRSATQSREARDHGAGAAIGSLASFTLLANLLDECIGILEDGRRQPRSLVALDQDVNQFASQKWIVGHVRGLAHQLVDDMQLQRCKADLPSVSME